MVMPTGLMAFGCVVYAFLCAVVLYGLYLTKSVYIFASRHRTSDLWFATIIPFCVFRLLWFFVPEEHYVHFVVNRLAWAFFLTAFSVIAIFWHDVYLSLSSSDSLLVTSRSHYRLFVLVNVVVWVFQALFVTVIVSSTNLSHRAREDAYDANIITITALTLVLAGLFAYFGTKMASATFGLLEGSPERSKYLLKITVSTVTFFVCFSLRVCMFIYRPATNGKLLPEAVFFPLAYLVPEVVPVMVELFLILVQRRTSHLNKLNIDDERGYDEMLIDGGGSSTPVVVDSVRNPSASTALIVDD